MSFRLPLTLSVFVSVVACVSPPAQPVTPADSSTTTAGEAPPVDHPDATPGEASPGPRVIESPGGEEQPAALGRIATPSWIPCDRSEVNGYIGRVIRYERREQETEIEIHTDWDTTEVVTLRHAPGAAASHFRIDTDPFREQDWQAIEQERGRLRPNVRVQAWVCQTAGNPTVIDWRPGEITPPNPY